MARLVVLSFSDDEAADTFVRDISLGQIVAWERGRREGVKVEAIPLAVVKPSTLFNGPLSFDHWRGNPAVIRDED